MRSSSPSIEGFRLALRQPSIVLAEVVWRWTFGLAAFLLATAFLLEYAYTLPVTTLDRLLLASRQPALALAAIQRIFAGSAFRFTTAGVILAFALTLGWIILAAFGRAVTLYALTEKFDIQHPPRSGGKTFCSLLALNFLRAANILAALVAVVGSAIFTSSFWASIHIAVADAARVWAVLFFFVFLAWTTLNWFLSTAAVFVISDGKSALGALASTAGFCLDHAGAVVAVGSFFELLHLGAFIAGFGIALVLFSTISVLSLSAALFLALLVGMLYFSVADFLYIGRLGAYIAVMRGKEPTHTPGEAETSPGPSAPASIDQTELILSDMPFPAT
jgi:hypothetical protein